ncbi:hypothetical protein LZ30DRAFT_325589 [Colletotrichum cereale]|nr:hypothetical protein LZ30DRAFT_325589 [Colletotrichum cereale]
MIVYLSASLRRNPSASPYMGMWKIGLVDEHAVPLVVVVIVVVPGFGGLSKSRRGRCVFLGVCDGARAIDPRRSAECVFNGTFGRLVLVVAGCLGGSSGTEVSGRRRGGGVPEEQADVLEGGLEVAGGAEVVAVEGNGDSLTSARCRRGP